MNVQSHPDRHNPENVVIRWGDTGRAHVVPAADDQAIMKAWKNAVAEGLALGDHVSDETDRSVAREVQEHAGIRVTKDAGGGLIVAYWPDAETAAKLSALVAGTEGAVALNDLHLTLLYLDSSEGVEENDWDIELVAAVLKVFSTKRSPLEATVTGIGRFVGPEEEDVVIALIDCPQLAYFRDCIREELCYNCAIPGGSQLWNEDHGFIPHVTLAYVPKEEPSPAPLTDLIPFSIDNVTLAKGGNKVVYQLYAYESEDLAEMPVYRARLSLEKAGRVLSGANLAAVEDAIEQLTRLAEQERARGIEAEPDEAALEKRREFFAAIADEDADAVEGDVDYVVTKATEDRYTFGPLYAPERKDEHGEYVEGEKLQKAVWDYVRSSASEGRRLNLQHGDLGDIQVAEWVDIVTWPYDHVIKVATVDGEERELEMPAGTVYVGAIWDEDAWPLVKSGKLNGWSLGGRAVKVKSGKKLYGMKRMGDTPTTKADGGD